ncbi:PREDICTED: uncharacterized protein LOC100634600 [Amphimedon queenslandica]|uniref:Transcription factor CBF/NF-Y/archaeal histone domain-containing protein n=1 Tax=Amphimedon queenslandica TaxID=400682 RepID=A0A1X7VCI5_AMPQE|nr:PREDICTED: uncharacterized protein LOC100634600 [Amphimedon queenslandica]|eukprot:XP_003384836.3 PREDICTED: uncharacterized protein LOC100634600 [Amphimedon queenslandica]
MATNRGGRIEVPGNVTKEPVKVGASPGSKDSLNEVAIEANKKENEPVKATNAVGSNKGLIGGGGGEQQREQLQRAFLQLMENAKSHSRGSSALSSVNPVQGSQKKSVSIPLMDPAEFNRFVSLISSSSSSSSVSSTKSTKKEDAPLPKIVKKSPSKLLKIPRKEGPALTGRGSVKKAGNCTLPSNKVRLLMKTTPNAIAVSQESVAVAGKAAELFIRKLALDSYNVSNSSSTNQSQQITYTHLAQAVQQNTNQMKFLHDFVPHKVKAKDHITNFPPPPSPPQWGKQEQEVQGQKDEGKKIEELC